MAQVGGVSQPDGSVLGLEMATPSRIDLEYSPVPWSYEPFHKVQSLQRELDQATKDGDDVSQCEKCKKLYNLFLFYYR